MKKLDVKEIERLAKDVRDYFGVSVFISECIAAHTLKISASPERGCEVASNIVCDENWIFHTAEGLTITEVSQKLGIPNTSSRRYAARGAFTLEEFSEMFEQTKNKRLTSQQEINDHHNMGDSSECALDNAVETKLESHANSCELEPLDTTKYRTTIQELYSPCGLNKTSYTLMFKRYDVSMKIVAARQYRVNKIINMWNEIVFFLKRGNINNEYRAIEISHGNAKLPFLASSSDGHIYRVHSGITDESLKDVFDGKVQFSDTEKCL